MNPLIRWRDPVGCALIIASLGAIHGCAGNQGGTSTREDETVLDWNSPQMREVEKEWQE
jgi:hypothetical protein